MTKYRSIPDPDHDSETRTDDDDEEDDYEFRRWCGVRRSTVLFCFYILSYLTYLVLGGYIMSILETPNEEALKMKTRMVKNKFLARYPNVNRKCHFVSFQVDTFFF